MPSPPLLPTLPLDSTPNTVDPTETPIAAAGLPQLLTVEEVAEWLGVTPLAIRRRLARGTIPGARRLGRSVRFDAAELVAWSRRGTVEAEVDRG